MPDPSDDLTRRLRAEADRLDAAAPPIASADARSTAASPTSRRWLPAAAAVVVLAGIGAAWLLLSGDDDPEQLIVPANPPTTTTASTTPTDSIPLPSMGIAVAGPDGLAVHDFDGTPLDDLDQAEIDLGDGPHIDMPTGSVPNPLDPAEVPADCESAFGGGGIRVALCGSSLELVGVAGERQVLAGSPWNEESPLGGALPGLWRWALPSPDGRWILAQWSGDCDVPSAYLRRADLPLVSMQPLPMPARAAARALGWTPDGRAVIEVPFDACGRAVEEPGVYLLAPETGELSLVVELTDRDRAYVWRFAPPANVPERALSRALEELGLAACCGEPSHGGPDANSGVFIDDREIGILGTPLDGAPPLDDEHLTIELPLLHGTATFRQPDLRLEPDATATLTFDCGPHRWTLVLRDDVPVDQQALLELAGYLVPHLYCTLPPR